MSEHDDAVQSLWPLMDLVTPMALRVAATTNVADLLADGPLDAAALAERSGTDSDALARVLSHLAGQGVFVESTPGVFALNATAEQLRSDSPTGMRLWLDLEGFGGRMDLAFTELLHTVRTGEPSWQRVFGQPFWEYLADHASVGAAFDETMASGREFVLDAARGYAWPSTAHVVDVGGGTGALLASVLEENPDVRASLVDLPETVERGRKYLAERGVDERCTFDGQTFFDPLPARGDHYVLSSIVHDWPDAEAVEILRRCAEAAGSTGRVIVIESHTPEAGSFTEMNLRMLVLLGGRERTVDEYTELARRAGLRVAGVHTTPVDQLVLDCVPEKW
ncbi:methyltransferase [Allosaccharopolyspora coralli]|uniref:Methyltransferase n=1 Tax=Allosaccharopolyspora coralli TaxID=2665642 RepID=A0A5Q3Q3I7_9PSEU|nr:methyltransferase [Allosaccharopolyspora coralli]QGK69012.1 methyltransferase [Allosaccharopolyspora coralli]